MSKIIVGRHIDGITINPLEYLLDDNGKPMVFESEEKAKEFLRTHNVPDEEIQWMVFEELGDEF